MTEREILDRIVGSDHGLEDVTNAFSGFLYEPSPFEWRSSIELRGEIVSIDGVVLLDGFGIARFARRLSFERGDAHARHIVFEVDGNFRRQGIAFASYEASLRFYDRVGIRWVHLDADAMGIFVWPSFGLDFDKRSHKEQMIAHLRRSEVEPLPDPMGVGSA